MWFLLFLIILFGIIWLLSWPFRKYSRYKERKKKEAKKRKRKEERKKRRKRRRKAGLFSGKNEYPILINSKRSVKEDRVYKLDKGRYDVKRGKKEIKLYNSLCNIFGSKFVHHGNVKLYIGEERKFRTMQDVEYHLENDKVTNYYYPDIAYIDDKKDTYIDIEVDEPFYMDGNKKKAIHYHISGDRIDKERDMNFVSKGWCVIRFSEIQVKEEADRCAKYVYDCVQYISQNGSGLRSVKKRDYRGPSGVDFWSKKEAVEKSR